MSEEIEDGLTIELIEEHELHYMTRNVGGWTYMDTSSSYDDGYEYHEIVWKEDATGRFFAFDHRTNSWDTEGLYEQELNIRQVYPKEIVVTRYFDKP